ncbi:MAG: NADH:flavin oxidoreductase [Acidimicrobiia bacterium]|nr:NADH:flavin oxidoreductase [Acidimicrobiia bacterium]
MTTLHDSLTLTRGGTPKNRFALAPMTNCQSLPDGRLGDDEFNWLVKRAQGGFGLTMTCAATVQKDGVGFLGQLGIYHDDHVPGLTRLAAALRSHGTHAVVQLHHAGMRAPVALTGRPPQCPSDDKDTGAVAMSEAEVKRAIDDFVAAARRADRAGFDGVELHGAHGYLICEFLSPELNRRDDAYGGSLDNRARILFELVDGVRAVCRPDFSLGVRLSPERFGLRLLEIREVAQRLMREGRIDYLDMSLWDAFKQPEDGALKGRSLMSYFTDLERGSVRLGAAGKIMTGEQAAGCLTAGLDFVVIGRAAILHHDLPRRIAANPAFVPTSTPVTPGYLKEEGLSEPFVKYMRNWPGFVAEDAA